MFLESLTKFKSFKAVPVELNMPLESFSNFSIESLIFCFVRVQQLE